MYREKFQLVNRWRISGKLRTESDFHLGDGGWEKLSTRNSTGMEGIDADPDYATVCRDHARKPLIPATSLKGALRCWMETNGLSNQAAAVMGTEKHGAPVWVSDATLSQPARPNNVHRFWDANLGTCLTPSVVLDEATRTAKSGLLYYTEFVPAGAEFHLEILGQTVSVESSAAPVDACALLLEALAGAFSGGRSLGAGAANGWGRLRWELEQVQVADAAELAKWLAEGGQGSWRSALRAVPAPAMEIRGVERGVALRLELAFDGAMLVNDPTQTRKRDEARRIEAIGHAPLVDETGQPVLPASSLRGALRARARQIWQTLAASSSDLSQLPLERSELKRTQPAASLPAFYRLFGATGWRSPLEMSDFTLVPGTGVAHEQEFVALDRFTGGVAGDKKFNARSLWKPVFMGEIRLRTDRFSQPEPWAWLLLAYVLRDWIEGDGAIGFGRSKGYGAFRAKVQVMGETPEAQLLAGVLERSAVLADPRLDSWQTSLARELSR
jgi:CRISPR/Cas system CSM-associated protein Csm3 (group 7 of RAMP superfamily)